MTNIVVVTFSEPSRAYQGLSVLKEQDDAGRLSLYSAAVVDRDATGRPFVRDYADRFQPRRSPHGLIRRMLDGLVGFDYEVELATELPVGATGLFAEVGEYATEVVDSAMAQLGGTVYRQTIDEVRAAFNDAESAAYLAELKEERDAREMNRQERDRERAERHNERIDRLEERLHHLESQIERQKVTVP